MPDFDVTVRYRVTADERPTPEDVLWAFTELGYDAHVLSITYSEEEFLRAFEEALWELYKDCN